MVDVAVAPPAGLHATEGDCAQRSLEPAPASLTSRDLLLTQNTPSSIATASMHEKPEALLFHYSTMVNRGDVAVCIDRSTWPGAQLEKAAPMSSLLNSTHASDSASDAAPGDAAHSANSQFGGPGATAVTQHSGPTRRNPNESWKDALRARAASRNAATAGALAGSAGDGRDSAPLHMQKPQPPRSNSELSAQDSQLLGQLRFLGQQAAAALLAGLSANTGLSLQDTQFAIDKHLESVRPLLERSTSRKHPLSRENEASGATGSDSPGLKASTSSGVDAEASFSVDLRPPFPSSCVNEASAGSASIQNDAERSWQLHANPRRGETRRAVFASNSNKSLNHITMPPPSCTHPLLCIHSGTPPLPVPLKVPKDLPRHDGADETSDVDDVDGIVIIQSRHPLPTSDSHHDRHWGKWGPLTRCPQSNRIILLTQGASSEVEKDLNSAT